MELKKHDVLYDVYDLEVVPLAFVDYYLNENYAIFANKLTDKPVSVYVHRINELFKTEIDALKALEEVLLSKLQMNRERIKEITDY